MSLDPIVNFGVVTTANLYNSAATSIVLDAGQGAKLPAVDSDNPNPIPGYDLIWWDGLTYSAPSDDPNVEIVRVTAKVGDTLTIARAQQGTVASNKNSAGKIYKLALGPTAKMMSDINKYIDSFEDWYTVTWDFNGDTTSMDANGLRFSAGGSYTITGTGINGEMTIGTDASSLREWDIYSRIVGYPGPDPYPSVLAFGSSPHYCKMRMTSGDSTNTNKVIVFGFCGYPYNLNQMTNFTPGGSANGCFFRVNAAGSAANIFAVNKNGVFEIIATSSQVLYYIDGSLRTTLSTNIPTAAQAFHIGMQTTDAVGKLATIDWIKYTRPRT